MNTLQEVTNVHINALNQSNTPAGCKHYKVGCSVKCPDARCEANPFYACRLCHDEVMEETQNDPKKAHSLNRFEITQVKCSKCQFIQKVSNSCV